MQPGPRVIGIKAPDRFLLRAGVLLFLLGLLTGFVVPLLAIPRLGLASHLEGVMNGMFLMILGAIWGRLTLTTVLATLTFFAAMYGTFANWAATLLGAFWAAGRLMPIAGGGAIGSPAAEAIVTALLASLSAAMVLVCILLIWGLRK